MKQQRFCTYCRVFHEKNNQLIEMPTSKEWVGAYSCKECGSRYLVED